MNPSLTKVMTRSVRFKVLRSAAKLAIDPLPFFLPIEAGIFGC